MAPKKSITVNPALEELEVLAGEWEMVLSNARYLPDPTAVVRGSVADGEGLSLDPGIAAMQIGTIIRGARDERW